MCVFYTYNRDFFPHSNFDLISAMSLCIFNIIRLSFASQDESIWWRSFIWTRFKCLQIKIYYWIVCNTQPTYTLITIQIDHSLYTYYII